MNTVKQPSKNSNSTWESLQKLIQENEFALLGGALFMLIFIAYFPSLFNDWVWDDERYVRKNVFVHIPKGILYIWIAMQGDVNYWPMTHSLFWLQNLLWGQNPFGFHAVNLALHIGNSILLWRVLRHLKIIAAFWVALFFGIHPINVESVAWISELKNVWSMFLFLLSIMLYLKYLQQDQRKILVYAVILFWLSILAKSATVFMPPVLIFILLIKESKLSRRRIIEIIPFALISAGMALAFLMEEHFKQSEERFVLQISLFERIHIAVKSYLFYWKNVFVPYPLTTMYPMWDYQQSGLAFIWPFLALLLFLLFLLVCWKKKLQDLVIAFVYTWLGLFPVLGLFVHQMMDRNHVQDHYVYFAFPGFLLIVFEPVASLYSKYATRQFTAKKKRFFTWSKSILMLVLVSMTASAMALTYQQTKLYKNDTTLWGHNYQECDKCWYAAYVMGTLAFLEKQDYRQALKYFAETIEKHPASSITWSMRAITYEFIGEHEKAEANFNQALKIKQNDLFTLYNFSSFLNNHHRYEEALIFIDRSIQIRNYDPATLKHRGKLYEKLNKYNEALKDFEAALKFTYKEAEINYLLANNHWLQGKYELAYEYLDQALLFDPNFADAQFLMGMKYEKNQDFSKAEVAFRKAISGDPKLNRAVEHLTNILLHQGRNDQALSLLNQILTSAPEIAQNWSSRAKVYLQLGNEKEACQDFQKACSLGDCAAIQQYAIFVDCLKQ